MEARRWCPARRLLVPRVAPLRGGRAPPPARPPAAARRAPRARPRFFSARRPKDATGRPHAREALATRPTRRRGPPPGGAAPVAALAAADGTAPKLMWAAPPSSCERDINMHATTKEAFSIAKTDELVTIYSLWDGKEMKSCSDKYSDAETNKRCIFLGDEQKNYGRQIMQSVAKNASFPFFACPIQPHLR